MKRIARWAALLWMFVLLPHAAAAERISFAQITLPEPAIGAAAGAAAVSGSLPYTCIGTIWEIRTAGGGWTSAAQPFAAGAVYRARVTLRAKDGASFAQAADGTFDGFLDVLTGTEPESTAAVVNSAGDLELTVQFPALGGAAVTTVALSGWTAPIIGSKPSAEIAAALRTDTATVSPDAVTVSLRWQAKSGSGWSDWPVKDTFAAGTHYRAMIDIRLTGSHTFSFDAAGQYAGVVTVNGTPQSGTRNGDGLRIVIDCGTLRAQTISAVAITGLDAPEIGGYPSDGYTVSSTPAGAAVAMATQWQRSRDRTNWADISTTTTAASGYYYRVHIYLRPQNAQCAFTDQTTATINGQSVSCSIPTSGTFTGCLHLLCDFGALEVKPSAPRMTVQPTSVTVQTGDTAALHLAAASPDGGTLIYQWYTGVTTDRTRMTAIPGATSPDYTAQAESGTRYYCAAVWNRLGNLRSEPVYSDMVSVTGTARPTVGTPVFTHHPQSAAALLGDDVTLAAQAAVNGSGLLRLQWFAADDADFRDAKAIPGATQAEYTVPQIAGTRYYRLEARAVNGSLESAPVFSRTAAVTYTAPPATLERIEMVSPPVRLQYTVGELLDCTGLCIRVIRTDGSETRTDGFVCTPVVLHTAGTQQITVSYGGKHAVFDVSVAASPVGAADPVGFGYPDPESAGSSDVSDASGDTPRTSDVSGGHMHTGDGVWRCDAETHFQRCTCGAKVLCGAHEFVQTESGWVCSVCGFVSGTQPGGMGAMLVAVAIGIAALAAAIVVGIGLRRKKKDQPPK